MPKTVRKRVTPEENAKALRREVLKKQRTSYMERFTEFVEDSDNRILKASEAIAQNEFASQVVFDSKKSEDPLAKGVIDSFQLAIQMTTKSINGTKMKREAAIKLRDLVDKNEKVLIIEVLPLFDMLHGKEQ